MSSNKRDPLEEAIIFGLTHQLRMENDTESAQMTHADATAAFEKVFKEHFKKLHAYAYTIVKDTIAAEEMVQNVFCKLWERKEHIQVTQSVAAYLYRSVYHESLNYLKHQKIKAAYQSYATYTMNNESEAGGSNFRELEQRLEKVLNELPQQCRTIFR